MDHKVWGEISTLRTARIAKKLINVECINYETAHHLPETFGERLEVQACFQKSQIQQGAEKTNIKKTSGLHIACTFVINTDNKYTSLFVFPCLKCSYVSTFLSD